MSFLCLALIRGQGNKLTMVGLAACLKQTNVKVNVNVISMEGQPSKPVAVVGHWHPGSSYNTATRISNLG